MTIYSKYLQIKLLFYFAIVFCVFLSIIWLTQSLRFLELITIKGINFITFINVTAFLLLPMSYVCIPIAMLFAGIITFSNLDLSNELIVLKSVGISSIQIYKSILPVLALIYILHLSISLYFLPKSYKSFKSMHHELREALINATFEEGVFNTQNNFVTVYVDHKLGDFKYKNIFIYDFRNKDKPLTIMANYGELIETVEGPGFILQEGTHQVKDKETNQITLGFFKTYSFVLKINENIATTRTIDVNEMFLSQLLSKNGKNIQLVKQHIIHALQRMLWPLFNLLLPLVVILGICSNLIRRGTSFIKQLKVGLSGISIIASSLLLNNLALKKFDYIYITLSLIIFLCVYTCLRIRKI